MGKPTLASVTPLEVGPGASVCTALTSAFDEHATFDAVLIAAVVRDEDGVRFVRVYSSDLNRLERIGLAEEAKAALVDY